MDASDLKCLRSDSCRYELISGSVENRPFKSGLCGSIANKLLSLLNSHVDSKCLGSIFTSGTGFLIETNPDTVRAPDGAFVKQDRWEQLDETEGFLELAPDLAIEVVSPSDSFSYIESKAQMWLESGTRAVVIVDPSDNSVRMYRNQSNIDVFRIGDNVDVSDVVSGWSFDVADLF